MRKATVTIVGMTIGGECDGSEGVVVLINDTQGTICRWRRWI